MLLSAGFASLINMSVFFRDFHEIFDDWSRAIDAGAASDPKAVSYSKTVSRSFNSVDRVGEEHIHEVDGVHGKETQAVTRRLGNRAKTVTDVKDLKTGEVRTTQVRREMTDADDADFDSQWAKASVNLPRRTVASNGSDVKQISEKPK